MKKINVPRGIGFALQHRADPKRRSWDVESISRKSLARATFVGGVLASALAVSLEFAIRSGAPLPYALGALDLLVSAGLFALTVVPALVIVCVAPRFRR